MRADACSRSCHNVWSIWQEQHCHSETISYGRFNALKSKLPYGVDHGAREASIALLDRGRYSRGGPLPCMCGRERAPINLSIIDRLRRRERPTGVNTADSEDRGMP